MGDWLERYAAALDERLGRTGAGSVGSESTEALLSLAGDVAHSTGDRTNAPLSTFLAGRYVEARSKDGIAAEQAIAEAADVASTLISTDP